MICLAVLFALLLGQLTALAIPQESNAVPAGQNGYVHLTTHTSATDLEGVYKVRLSAAGQLKTPPIYVVFGLDGSSGMFLSYPEGCSRRQRVTDIALAGIARRLSKRD